MRTFGMALMAVLVLGCSLPFVGGGDPVERLANRIDELEAELSAVRKEQELKGFNQTWNQYLDREERIKRLNAEINDLRAEYSRAKSFQ